MSNPRRPGRRLGCALLTLPLWVVPAGCAAPVTITDPAPAGEIAEICTAVLADLPEEVLGSVSRDTTTEWARAWGDPPITLVCGGAVPEGLTPTSQCLEINGVGWWEQDGDRGTVWTTIGRSAVITVGVPAEYGDPVSALAQVSTPIADHNPVDQPCVG